jgi:hypothetical protein
LSWKKIFKTGSFSTGGFENQRLPDHSGGNTGGRNYLFRHLLRRRAPHHAAVCFGDDCGRIFQRINSYAIYRIAETLRVLLFMTLTILLSADGGDDRDAGAFKRRSHPFYCL